MYYEINVSFYGKHYFATAPRSITTEAQLQHIVLDFATKFPEDEGYEISITKQETIGYILDFHEVRAEAIAENNRKLVEWKARKTKSTLVLDHPDFEITGQE